MTKNIKWFHGISKNDPCSFRDELPVNSIFYANRYTDDQHHNTNKIDDTKANEVFKPEIFGGVLFAMYNRDLLIFYTIQFFLHFNKPLFVIKHLIRKIINLLLQFVYLFIIFHSKNLDEAKSN